MNATSDASDDESHNETSSWQKHEVSEIVSKIIASAGRRSFQTEAKEIDWDSVKTEGREAEECQNMFMKLTSSIRKHRTMAEILSDIKSSLPECITNLDRARRPISGFLMYTQEKRVDMKEKYPDLSSKQRVAKLRKKWDKSDKLREMYRDKHKAAYNEYMRDRPETVRFASESKPVVPTPFLMYSIKKKASVKAKNPQMDGRQINALLKSKYNKLGGQKKFHFMLKALRKMPEYKAECEAFQNNNAGFEPKSYELYSFLSSEEKKVLIDQYPKPELPPKNVYLFYCKKERPNLHEESIVDHAKELAASYSKLSSSTRADYEKEYEECIQSSIEKLTEYVELVKPWGGKLVQAASKQMALCQVIYEERHKKLYNGRKRLRISSKPVVPTPFLIYYYKKEASVKEKNPEMDGRQIKALLKPKYAELGDEKKFHFMLKALKQMPEYKAQCEAFQEKNPEFKPKSYNLYPFLSKEEKKVLNDHYQKPESPPKNFYLFYCFKERPNLHGRSFADQGKDLSVSYSKLSSSTTADYEKEYKECLKSGIKNLSEYLEHIKPWSDELAGTVSKQIIQCQKVLNRKSNDKKTRDHDVNESKSTAPTLGKRKASDLSEEESSVEEENMDEVQTFSTKKKKNAPEKKRKTELSYILSGTTQPESQTMSSSEESESEVKDIMHRISPLKTPKKTKESSSPLKTPKKTKESSPPLKTPKKKKESSSPLKTPQKTKESSSPLKSPKKKEESSESESEST